MIHFELSFVKFGQVCLLMLDVKLSCVYRGVIHLRGSLLPVVSHPLFGLHLEVRWQDGWSVLGLVVPCSSYHVRYLHAWSLAYVSHVIYRVDPVCLRFGGSWHHHFIEIYVVCD